MTMIFSFRWTSIEDAVYNFYNNKNGVFLLIYIRIPLRPGQEKRRESYQQLAVDDVFLFYFSYFIQLKLPVFDQCAL